MELADKRNLRTFILEHRSEPLDKLAFSLSKRKDIDTPYVLRQVEGWQRLRRKVPAWAAVDDLEYPPRLSLEQCSGEEAARYKAALVGRLWPEGGAGLVDLTGGLGVDFSFLAPLFRHAVYVERQPELVSLARHNMPLLGCTHAEVVEDDAVHYLENMPPADLIYLDPARRDQAGRKTVSLADCTPDALQLLPLLLAKSRYVLLKLSPLFDLTMAERQLGCVREAHVLAAGGECKELLLLLSSSPAANGFLPIVCADDDLRFTFTRDEEASAHVEYTAEVLPGHYLYEPSAALLKAGAFRTLAARTGARKLHPDSHLYVSPTPVTDFPGRAYRVLRVGGFSRTQLRAFRGGVKAAGLTVRGFPATVKELRRRLGIADGGDEQWFAVTLADGTHALIAARRLP